MKVRLGSIEIGLARYLALWTAVVIVFAAQGVVHDTLIEGRVWALSAYLRWSMIQWYTWAALAPMVSRLSARHPIQPSTRWRALAVHVPASIGVSLLALAVGACVSSLVEESTLSEQMRHYLGKYFAVGLLTYWTLVAIEHSLRLQAEKARRELEASRLATELAQSRLQALKTQLQPHFLFNTLHAIVTLLDEDKLSAEDMLLRLSDLLRAFLEDYDGQEISLRQELVLLDLYLGIQHKRYGERLATHIYVAPDALDCAVPSLILQPIVENAIRHGIGERLGSDRIEIEARREEGALHIEVRNSNSTLEPEAKTSSGHGIGLSNTALRLRELYGDAAEVRLDMIWPKGVVCRIRLPAREIEASEASDTAEAAA